MVLSSHRPGTVPGTSGVAHQDYLVPLCFAHKLLGIGKNNPRRMRLHQREALRSHWWIGKTNPQHFAPKFNLL